MHIMLCWHRKQCRNYECDPRCDSSICLASVACVRRGAVGTLELLTAVCVNRQSIVMLLYLNRCENKVMSPLRSQVAHRESVVPSQVLLLRYYCH